MSEMVSRQMGHCCGSWPSDSKPSNQPYLLNAKKNSCFGPVPLPYPYDLSHANRNPKKADRNDEVVKHRLKQWHARISRSIQSIEVAEELRCALLIGLRVKGTLMPGILRVATAEKQRFDEILRRETQWKHTKSQVFTSPLVSQQFYAILVRSVCP